MEKIAVITGATRGLGWGTAEALARQGYRVLLLGRNPARLEERKVALCLQGFSAEAFVVDMAQSESIEACARKILAAHPTIDILVNNAGVFLEKGGAYDPALVRATVETNTLAPLQLAMALAPALLRGKASVVNVSSGMGGLTEMNGGYPGYRISKAGLNAVTRILSEEWKARGVRVNSVCPGWVRTEMGGPEAERSLEEGVASILWAATLGADGPTGGFFRDGKKLAW